LYSPRGAGPLKKNIFCRAQGDGMMLQTKWFSAFPIILVFYFLPL